MDRKYVLLIDGDIIPPSFLEAIITEVSKEGELLIKRLYGDWTTPNMNGWKSWLEKIPIRPVQQFRNGPNATDNTIIMDAIELANTNKSINAVCIVSTDSDYYSLALKLREYGLYVLGIGKQNAKRFGSMLAMNLNTWKTSIAPPLRKRKAKILLSILWKNYSTMPIKTHG